MWDIANLRSPSELAAIARHTNLVYSVTFSPDGRALATSGWDRTARITPTNTGDLITYACDHVRTQITEAKWNQHFPGITYNPPCQL